MNSPDEAPPAVRHPVATPVFHHADVAVDGRASNAAENDADEAADKSSLVAAVRGLENKSTGGVTKLLTLFVSLAVFIAVGAAWWEMRMVLLIVIVLLFHESGHYVAMRSFGYRNVKMFFVPFLGAAVSGRHFNISPWKKALVYLAGPVPGIVLAFPLLAAGLMMERSWMLELGAMSLLLNTLNLLPILPLDGGWIVHLTLLSRSPILELIARLGGIGVMFAFAILSGSPILLIIAIPLMIALPTTFRVSAIVRRLRDRELPQPEVNEIPATAIRLLDEEMRSTPLAKLPIANRAALIVQMYESLIVRPPGLAAALAIWIVYVGAAGLGALGGYAILISRDRF